MSRFIALMKMSTVIAVATNLILLLLLAVITNTVLFALPSCMLSIASWIPLRVPSNASDARP